MGRDLSRPILEVTFRCPNGHRFEAEPGRVVDTDDYPHPWDYFADCPECGVEAAQIWWERNLMKSHGKQTGPRTPEGKAAASPKWTPEQKARIKYNSLKHGRYLRAKTFFPARPGQYAFCSACEVPHDVCGANQFCITQTGHLMRIVEAFEAKDPSQILDLLAAKQAHFQAIIDMAILAIINEGVSIHQPVYEMDKEGKPVFIKMPGHDGEDIPLIEIKSHPLLKFLGDAMQKNSMSLADMAMTPKVQESGELLRGYLDEQETAGAESIEYQRRSTEALENLQQLIERSRRKAETDPVLIEYKDE